MSNKKSRKWLIILLVLAIIILAALAVAKGKNKPRGTAVTFEEVKKRTVSETVTASGKIFPETEVKISSDVSGEIVNLYVEEGDSVVTGQILAKIDPDSYISAVERGRASVNNAKAQLSISNAQIENSKALFKQTKAQLTNAEKVHERNVSLKKDGVISQADFEQSLSSLEGLQASLAGAEANLKSSEQSAEGARYTIQSANANLKELLTSLNRTTIKAPTNGTISSLSVEQGERVVGTIQMAGTEMMRIANLNSMEVQVDVSENDILKVSIGDTTDIEVDAYLDKKFKGVVTEIANSASNIGSGQMALNTDQVTNFIVKIRIDTDSYKNLVSDTKRYPFRPGMSASVDIYTERERDVLTIPIQAVTVREPEDEDEKDEIDRSELEEIVFVHTNDTVAIAKVVTGIQDDEYIVVKSGLEEGQEIVSGPYSAVSKKLESGSAVREKKDKDDKDDDK